MLPWTRPTLFESGEKDKRSGGGSQKASEVFTREEQVTDIKTKLKYQHQVDTAVAMARQAHTTDMEEQKNLDTAERRGVEAVFDYQARREAGMAPKDEYNSKESRYSRENIEEGLLHRETHNGVEYSVQWDKNGELISIQKGDKGSVATYAPKDKNGASILRDGILTHTHPSEIWDNDNKKLGRDGDASKYNESGSRLHGLPFSQGDVNNHGRTERLETRAVGREGIHIMRGNGATLDDRTLNKLRLLKPSLHEEYTKGDKWVKNRITMEIASVEIAKANKEVMRYGNAVLGADYKPTGNDKWFNSQHCLAMMATMQSQILGKYGVQYEFKPAKGYEGVARAVKSGSFDGVRAEARAGNLKTGTDLYRAGQPPATGITPIDTKGNTIPAGRTAKALATKSTGGDGKAKRSTTPKAPKAPKPPKVTDIKPPKAPAVKTTATPPKSVGVTTPTGNYTVPTGSLFGGGSLSGGGGGFLTGGTFTFGR